MDDYEIIYADVSTPERREDYVQNSAQIPCNLHGDPRVEQILSTTPTERPFIPSYDEPQGEPPAKRARTSEEPKRQYSFVNQAQ